MGKLILGGTTRNVTPQIFETHPTLRQHRNSHKESFSFQITYQKVIQSHREFKNLINFTKKMCFDVENECIKKKIMNVTQGIVFIKNTKGIYFLGIFIVC
jgi:hypothetical protein